MSDQESSSPSGGPPPPGPPGAPGGPPPNIQQLGMVSHKMSLTTIFGHKHIIKNFIKKFDIFQLQKGLSTYHIGPIGRRKRLFAHPRSNVID